MLGNESSSTDMRDRLICLINYGSHSGQHCMQVCSFVTTYKQNLPLMCAINANPKHKMMFVAYTKIFK